MDYVIGNYYYHNKKDKIWYKSVCTKTSYSLYNLLAVAEEEGSYYCLEIG